MIGAEAEISFQSATGLGGQQRASMPTDIVETQKLMIVGPPCHQRIFSQSGRLETSRFGPVTAMSEKRPLAVEDLTMFLVKHFGGQIVVGR